MTLMRPNAGVDVGAFGDIVIYCGHIEEAPAVAPIHLSALIGNPDVTYDSDNASICLYGEVWYQPIDLTDANVLICVKIADVRPGAT